jgi:hypothetical protein
MNKTKQEMMDYLENKYFECETEFQKGVILTLLYVGKHSKKG